MRVSGQVLGEHQPARRLGAHRLPQRVGLGCQVGHRDAVDDKPVVAQFEHVAGQSDHALDQAPAVGGRPAGDDIAARGTVARDQHRPGERQAQPVGQLVDDDPVADQQRGLHRTAGNVVPVGDRGTERQQAQEQQTQRERSAAPQPEQVVPQELHDRETFRRCRGAPGE